MILNNRITHRLRHTAEHSASFRDVQPTGSMAARMDNVPHRSQPLSKLRLWYWAWVHASPKPSPLDFPGSPPGFGRETAEAGKKTVVFCFKDGFVAAAIDCIAASHGAAQALGLTRPVQIPTMPRRGF